MVDEDLSIYINDYLGGESLNSLEKRTRISSGKLKRFFIKEGIEIRQCHKMNDELAHEIFDLYESGLTLKEVAKKLDLNVLTVSKTMDKYGVSRRSNSEYKREPVETISYFDTISKEELDTYIQAYLNGEGIHSMWKRTGKSKYSIRNMLVKNGIDIRQRKVIPKDLEPTFVELYKSGVSSCEIGRRYNVVHGSVCKILERHGIERRDDYEKKREYPIDHTFFDSIHDEKTAYFFGLLFADGTINDTHNIIKIGLIEEDKGVLEILTSYIQPTKPMVVYDYAKMRNNPKLKFQYAMTIHSIYIGENLVSYGMIPRKTKIKVFPEVVLNSSEDIIRHFIRGYFDGNGSYVLSRSKKDKSKIVSSTFRITSNYNMCSSIVSVIKKYTGVEGWILPDHDSFDVSIGKLLNCKIVSDWMYKDATIYIPRKYEKYLLIKEKVKQKYED